MSTLTVALLYTRVSDDDQADAATLAALGKRPKSEAARRGLSLQTQLDEIRRYVAYQPDWVIGDEYKDVLSGKRDDRPDYQRLLADAKRVRAEGRRVAVVVAALDRFGRSVRERVACWEALTPLGAEFHSVREGGRQQEWMYNMLATLAQEESRRLGERVGKVRQHIRENGWKAPGRAALGFTWRPATEAEQRQGAPESVLIPDETTAPIVREAFERAAGGESVRSVARWIAGLPSEAKAGRLMGWRAVQVMLTAPVYVARPDEGDDVLDRPPTRWEPLVSDATWAAVRDQLTRNKKTARQASGRYLLAGLVWCACGQRLGGGATPGGKRRKDGTRGTYRRYRCVGFLHGANTCRDEFSSARLDEAVVARVAPIVALTDDEPMLRTALGRAWKRRQQDRAPDPGVRARIGQLERIADRARGRLKNAAMLLVDGKLDPQGYQDVREQAEQDLENAERELERLRGVSTAPPLPDLPTVLRAAGALATAWRSDDPAMRREVLVELIERITPTKTGRGVYDPSIVWTELGELLADVAR